MMRLLRPALVVARRDFTATVLTPAFLVFLLAPLLMLSIGAVGGFGAAQVAEQGRGQQRLLVIAAPAEAAAIEAADASLRRLFGPDDRPAALATVPAGPDPAAQARRLFLSGAGDVAAVLYGPLARPVIVRGADGGRAAGYLAAVANAAAGAKAQEPVDTVELKRAGGSPRARAAGGFAAVFVMFLLTILLAGQAIGMLAEERSNKVIEILAAAVPLEAVFFGKLLGLLGVAFLFIGFWGVIGAQAIALLPASQLDQFAPEGGIAGFVALFLAYFVMAFLLFGAVFLGIGAQAGSQRELQMMTLPVTLFQVAMFGFASGAAGAPDTTLGQAAAIFPFSSPFAMAARASTGAPAWQHAAAFAWQALWLAVTITVAARLFRRGVLKSGGVKRKKVEL